MSLARLDPRTTTLVVVDVQTKLAAAMPTDAMDALVRGSSILLEAARVLGVRVLATEQYPEGLGPTLPALADKLATLGVRPSPKMTFSAVGDTAFLAQLAAPLPRHVVVIGMETHICVVQTVRDLLALGVSVHVPLDAVVSRRDDHRAAGLGLCERAGAAITTAETVAFDWLERAGTPEFKAISRLVR